MTEDYNMQDYLYWRGDILFSTDPFNEVDNLILAQASYVDFDGIVPESGDDKIPIREVYNQYWLMHTKEEIMQRESFVKLAPFLLEPLAESRRFGNMKLSGYVNHINKDTQAQMSAVRFELDDGSVYVAFRGTDETLVGWKEDFNLSFMSQTEGQRLAVEYMKANFSDTNLWLRVGGHSKGGNFAVYASAFSGDAVNRQIMEVYTNDGPGFRPEVTGTSEYRNILKKTISIVPRDSVIGWLLSSELTPRVVMSSATRIRQHDALTWQIKGNRFVKTEQSKESWMLEKTLSDWLVNVDDESRKIFVDQIFNILEATGADTMKDVRTATLSDLAEAFQAAINLPKDQQKEVSEVLTQLFKSGEKTFYEQLENIEGWIPPFIRKWAARKEEALSGEKTDDEPGSDPFEDNGKEN